MGFKSSSCTFSLSCDFVQCSRIAAAAVQCSLIAAATSQLTCGRFRHDHMSTESRAPDKTPPACAMARCCVCACVCVYVCVCVCVVCLFVCCLGRTAATCQQQPRLLGASGFYSIVGPSSSTTS